MKATKTSSITEQKQKMQVKQAGALANKATNASGQQAGELPEHFLQVELQYQSEAAREQQKDCVLGYN